jgi:hypothetical protein
LAVHERAIVTPGSVKQLVAFPPHREALGDVFVVDEAVAEIEMRAQCRPEMICSNGLNGLNAPGAIPTSSESAAKGGTPPEMDD